MFCRTIAAALILLSATVPASALTGKPLDEALATAAARMKVKDYSGARQAALKSSQNGARAFLVGMTDVRLEMWDEAASQLAAAADAYPILADYALYNEGLALSKLGRSDEALTPLYRLLKQYPDSRLARAATLLYADCLAAGGHHKEALQSYITFIERYPSGSDSISALFNSALCREKLGDPGAAAGVLRGIWLNDPTSPYAEKAAGELQRVQSSGTRTEPYSTAELFKRAGILYDLGRYKQAAEAYAALTVNSEGQEFNAKLRLKYGQALFKARRYRDAETTLTALYEKQTGSTAAEAGFWLGRALDKNGKGADAYDLYLRLSNPAKGSSFADDALLEAAYLKRYQRNWGEAVQLFKRYLTNYPDPQRNGAVLWETAWASYQSRDYRGAAEYLKKLAEREELREKALYWLGKSLAASGDATGAEASFAALATEYPFGYYTLLCGRWCDISQFPAPPGDLAEAIPMPAGYEREKALIALGLYDEAGRELAAKKNKSALAMARLYLEMGNYNGAYHAVAALKAKRGERDSDSVWGINYPLAYRDDVVKNAAANGIPESLVYAIMRAESNYSPGALSPVGAVGLMQIMPATAETISKGDSGKLARPDLNIRLGSRHLKDLLSLYDKNITLAAAAYNAGSGNVKRWQKGLGSLPQDEFVESIPFRETREYVKKVVTAMELYQRLYRLPAKNVVKVVQQ
jgi:soluble lytic murein transglycosylase